MPEYLAPGVYVEETSFRAKVIEGVSTTTTAFVGPTRNGPLDGAELVTSLAEFERIFGDGAQLGFTDGGLMHNYVWHATRAFFEEGGKRLYVTRAFRADTNDGCAKAVIPADNAAKNLQIRARYPGKAGNMRVRLTAKLGQNLLSYDATSTTKRQPRLGALGDHDVVFVELNDNTTKLFCLAQWNDVEAKWEFKSVTYDNAKKTWELTDANVKLAPYDVGSPEEKAAPKSIRVLTLAVTVIPAAAAPTTWDGLALAPKHRRNGAADSVFAKFSKLDENRFVPIVVEQQGYEVTAAAIIGLLSIAYQNQGAIEAFKPLEAVLKSAVNEGSSDAERSLPDLVLSGGNDGKRPGAEEYKGTENAATMKKSGLTQLEDIEDVSIVAAPGATAYYKDPGYHNDARQIVSLLISHATRMRYRIAVLDSGNEQTIADVRAMRAEIDSSHAALYYPWVRVLDPITRAPIDLPPSGFVAGIYCRNDTNRAVYKAPANEVVNLAIGLEVMLNKAQQDILNPEGINAFRFFEGRGYRLWGARTTSSDAEWKYVNVRRYFAYLERSIERGTQWAVFEPNGELLWGNVRRTIEDFLLNEWQSGALLGDRPEKAFFVRCDRTTMTQNDLDNGRLICLVGVAPLRPAEYVVFRIGQWTADRKS